MPQRVIFEDGRQIDYLYDTAGTKRQVTYRNSATAQPHLTIDYCGNVIYENGVLSKILTEEGYITYNGSTPVYHYYIKDHLGNVRVVLNQDGTVEQRNEYYPFGGLFADGAVQGNTTNQRYRYNGKELDREFGIDMYDYEARQMDPSMGRFTTMDPMAEKYYGISPYAYVANNPINAIDPDGNQTVTVVKGARYASKPSKFRKMYQAIKALIFGGTVGAGGAEVYNHFLEGDKSQEVFESFMERANNSTSNAENTKVEEKDQIAPKNDRTADDELRQDEHGNKIPDAEAEGTNHTQLGTKEGRKGKYKQAREFDEKGSPQRDIDFTDHGRPKSHPNRHQHRYRDNPTGGTRIRGKMNH